MISKIHHLFVQSFSTQELGLSADKPEPGLLFRISDYICLLIKFSGVGYLDRLNLVRPSRLRTLITTLKERYLSTKPKTQTLKPWYLVEII